MRRASSYVEPDMFGSGVSRWPFVEIEGVPLCRHLEPRAYSLVMIDPCWHFVTRSPKGDEKSPQAKYRTMTLADIAALPVGDLAHADGCLFWVWVTGAGLRDQMRMLDAWGLRFVTSGAWVKTTVHGKLAFGTGYVLRNCHEPYIIAASGRPVTKSKSVRSAILAPVREHSRKPDEAYRDARLLIPTGRAADVFSCQTRPGWEAWGNEAGLYDKLEAA